MNVFIVRNARLESNAGLLRILNANIKNGYHVSVVSRNRDIKNKQSLKEEKYVYLDQVIKNFVIEINALRGAGVKNILPLLKYQFILFYTLYKNRNEMDIIHAFDLDTGLISLIFSKIFRKKLVYHIADLYADSRMNSQGRAYSLIKKLEFFVINHADGTIIANENRKMQIKGSQPKNLTVIHNAPMMNPKDIEELSIDKSKTLSTNQPVLAYVGGLTEQRFINEVLEFGVQHPDFTLVLAGYGPIEDKVTTYAENYPNIHYLGELSYQDSLALYAQSDVMFAMYDPRVANHKYSAPNKVYEAMMLNKPIVVAANSGVDTLVTEEDIGVVADYDLTDFTEKVSTLVDNPQRLKTIKKNLTRAYTDYSWDKMVARLDTLYQKILNNDHKAS